MPLSADDNWAEPVSDEGLSTRPDWWTGGILPLRQQERPNEHRTRILGAAIGAAASGGYDKVLMRDIASRAGVSIGTVYQYFPSKVHLLVTALDEGLSGFVAQVSSPLGLISDPFARLRYLVDRLSHAMQSSDRMAEALTHAYATAYTMVLPEADVIRDRTVEMFSRGINFAPEDDTPFNRGLAELLTDVWTCEIFAFSQGRCTLADLRARLLTTIDLLDRPPPPPTQRTATYAP